MHQRSNKYNVQDIYAHLAVSESPQEFPEVALLLGKLQIYYSNGVFYAHQNSDIFKRKIILNLDVCFGV